MDIFQRRFTPVYKHTLGIDLRHLPKATQPWRPNSQPARIPDNSPSARQGLAKRQPGGHPVWTSVRGLVLELDVSTGWSRP